MIVVILTALVLAGVLLFALYTEQPPAQPQRVTLRTWDGPPTPEDISSAEFPLAVAGYERAAVQAHLDRVADAFRALLAAHEAVDAMAERRVRVAMGLDPDDEDDGAADDGAAVDRADQIDAVRTGGQELDG